MTTLLLGTYYARENLQKEIDVAPPQNVNCGKWGASKCAKEGDSPAHLGVRLLRWRGTQECRA